MVDEEVKRIDKLEEGYTTSYFCGKVVMMGWSGCLQQVQVCVSDFCLNVLLNMET